MNRIPRAWLPAALCLAALAGGCSSTATPDVASAAARDPRVSGVVLVRSYEDEFKIDGSDVRVRVEYSWDYEHAVTLERISNLDGSLRSLTELPDLTLNLTPAELEYAYDLVRRDPDLGPQIAHADTLSGGFSYRESDDPACYEHSRCAHVVATTGDGSRKLVHAIVDLQRGVIVHPHFHSDSVRPFAPTEIQAFQEKQS